jgi:hypothetical protein
MARAISAAVTSQLDTTKRTVSRQRASPGAA